MKEFIISPAAKVKLIEHGSNAYNEMIELRYEILRKPLRLNFTSEQLEAEKNNYHLGYYLNEMLIACLMLVPEDDGRIKMKQVAVLNEYQGKGVGASIVQMAEKLAIEMNFKLMYCHARDTAIPFYKKLNYHETGFPFNEVSIPHMQMEKSLK